MAINRRGVGQMKEKRQNAIISLIEENDIETQDVLAERLKQIGFKVTQATISRDIKELHLIKIQTENGVYKYAVNNNKNKTDTEKLLRVFRETVLSIATTGSLIVINTLSGSAAAAAEVIDKLAIDGVLGTIAGDNTIFLAAKDAKASEQIVAKLKQMAK